MTDPPVEFESADFEAVLAPFEETEEWIRRNTGGSPAAAVTAATAQEGAVGELFYTHRTTDAALSLQFPDDGTPPGLLTAFLDQPLDPCLARACDASGDAFSAGLCRAQHAIAAIHATAYITPVADPELILRVHVPLDYSEHMLHETIAALDAITVAVKELHDAITAPLAEY